MLVFEGVVHFTDAIVPLEFSLEFDTLTSASENEKLTGTFKNWN